MAPRLCGSRVAQGQASCLRAPARAACCCLAPALLGTAGVGRDGSLCVTRKLLGSRLRSFFPGWSLRVRSLCSIPSHAQRSVTGVVRATGRPGGRCEVCLCCGACARLGGVPAPALGRLWT